MSLFTFRKYYLNQIPLILLHYYCGIVVAFKTIIFHRTMKKIIIIIAVFVVIYAFRGGSEGVHLAANEIDPDCDIVVFTTETCPYCAKARELLDNSEHYWCEFDINESREAHRLFKELGGRGVPFAFIGNQEIRGYNQAVYQNALNEIEQSTDL
jgi:glutaredoxin